MTRQASGSAGGNPNRIFIRGLDNVGFMPRRFYRLAPLGTPLTQQARILRELLWPRDGVPVSKR